MIFNKNRTLLYLITVLNDAAINLIIFFTTRYMAEHGAGIIKLGVIGGIFALSFAVSSLIFGRLSDTSGRKRIILAGIALVFVGTVGCFFVVPTKPLFYLFYIFIGISPGLIYPALVAWLGQDPQHKSRRGVSGRLLLFTLSWNAGVVIGMITGGSLYQLRYEGPIIASLIFLGVNCILILLCKEKAADKQEKESERTSHSKTVIPEVDLKNLLLYKRLGRITALGSASCMSTILFLFPQIAVEIGLPADDHGMIVAIMRATVIGTFLTMHFFSFWKYNLAVMLTVEAAGIVGLLLVFSSGNVSIMMLGLLLIGFLNGYGNFGGLYYSNHDPNSMQKGRDSGLHQGFLGIGVATGSVLGGIIGNLFGSRFPFLLSAIILLLIIGIQLFTVSVRRRALRIGYP